MTRANSPESVAPREPTIVRALDWFMARSDVRFASLTPMEIAQGRFVVGLVLLWTALALFFAGYIWSSGGATSLVATCVGSTVLWSAMLAHLRRTGDVRRVGAIFCSLLVIIIALGAFASTGVAVLMGPWGVVSPLIATFVLGFRRGVMFAVVVVALAVVAALAQTFGAFVPEAQSVADFGRADKHLVSGSFVLAAIVAIGGLYEAAQLRARRSLESTVTRLAEARAALAHAERLSLAADLAGAVAHELNTPLFVVQTNVECLRRIADDVVRLRAAARNATANGGAASAQAARDEAEAAAAAIEGDELIALADDALVAAARIADLVARFKDIARPAETLERQHISVAALVEDCVRAAATSTSVPTTMELAAAGDTYACHEELRVAIGEVLVYLSSRARKAVSVTLRDERASCLLSICDKDRTLTSAERERVFDPHVESETMRLNTGLAVAHKLFAANGATLSLDESTDGLRFLISLPHANRGPRAPAASQATNEPTQHSASHA